MDETDVKKLDLKQITVISPVPVGVETDLLSSQ
jgi:hypothetical protein